jgi:glycosyltransferase involved in cell wall biosynthesis
MLTKDQPLISVVIPTYNHAEFLRIALESVIRQKYSSWEVIVIDNHSNDHTDEIVESFNDSKIRLLKIHNNGVIGASRNYGIHQAKGEWISFMDSDDLWYPTKLATCVEFCKDHKDKFDVISTDEIMVFTDSDKKRVLNHGPSSKHMYRDMLLYGNRLSPSATMVRSSFLKEHSVTFSESKDFVTAEDYDFWLQLAWFDAKFLFIEKIEGEYLIHGANASGHLNKQISANMHVVKKHVFELQDFESDRGKLWGKMKARIYFSDAIKRFQVGGFIKMIKPLSLSLASSPAGFIDFVYKKLMLRMKKAK